MSYRICLSVIVAVALLVTPGTAQVRQQPIGPIDTNVSPAPQSTTPQVFEQPTPRYRLQKGDTIELGFPFTPEFNQTVTVQPDGFVTLRAMGDVQAAGMTVPDLTTALHKKYSTILNDPMIQITVRDFEKPYFVVNGHVGAPGKYEMRGDMTLSQAVAIAGGFAPDARTNQVILFRRTSEDWVEVKEVDLKKMLKGEIEEDVDLRAGDMVFVPRSRLAPFKSLMSAAALRLYFR